MDTDASFSYVPCGHKCICSTCVRNVPQCPLCRRGYHPIRIYESGDVNETIPVHRQRLQRPAGPVPSAKKPHRYCPIWP